MSPASTSVLLGAILEDFSQVGRTYARISTHRRIASSTAVACRAVEAEEYRDRVHSAPGAETDQGTDTVTPLLIHGAAPSALAAWKSATLTEHPPEDRPARSAHHTRTRIYGIDIARSFG